MQIHERQIYGLHAELCSMMANPTRLAIFHALEGRELCVGKIAEALDIGITSVSQNLRLLRDKGLVKSRKEGQTVYYRLTSRKIMQAYRIIRDVLVESMSEQGVIAESMQSMEREAIPVG